MPFTAERFFLVFGVPNGNTRGSHAHREQHQLLAVQGTIEVDVIDGDTTSTFVLDAPSKGLLLPRLQWATERQLSADAVLLVLASGPYERANTSTSSTSCAPPGSDADASATA